MYWDPTWITFHYTTVVIKLLNRISYFFHGQKRSGESAISDQVAKLITNETWEEWFSVFDDWGAPENSHKLTARYLLEEWKLSP